MRHLNRTALALVALIAAAPVAAQAGDAVQDAIADPTRIEKQRARDEGRKPAAILNLVGVKAGDKVADLAAGGGYYTALLSRLVGPDGKVYAVDPQLIFDAFPNAKDGFPNYLKQDPRGNIEYSVQRFDALTLPEPIDAVFMVLYYHDTVWTGEDRANMNKAIFEALKPGGAFLVVDHHGLKDAGVDITKSLHRMDATPVIPEVTNAGFVLETNSDLLAHPDDARDVSVFDSSIRGKTDRFVYLFRKPE
jgi:predicted methyltransferase